MAATGTNVGLDFTYLAGADLSLKQYFFVKQSTAADRTCLLCDTTAGEAALGILQNDPTSAQAAEVRTGGRSSLVYGGTVTRGDLLASDAAGKGVKYTKATVFTGTPYIVSGSPVLAVAEESGAAGEQHGVLISFRGLHG